MKPPNVHVAFAAGPASAVEPMAPTLPRGGGKTMMSTGTSRPNVPSAKTLTSNNDLQQAIARADAMVGQGQEHRPQTAIGIGALGPLDGQTPAQPQPRAHQPSGAELRSPPKSGRKGTKSGRRSNPNLLSETEAAASEPATRPVPPGAAAVVPTKRFEDEVTVEHDRPTVIVRYDDLDEKTNVIAGRPRAAAVEEPAPPSSRGRRRGSSTGVAAASEPEDRKKTVVPGSSEPPPALANELSRITSFRVALVSDPARGSVEVLPLVPNEPAPAGLVTAILVPVDGTSSRQIAEILATKKRRS